MTPRSYSWPDGHWDWYQHLAFKHGIQVGDLIFVGGQVDKTDKGEPLNAYDLARQSAAVVSHIGSVLHGFEVEVGDCTKLVAFYVNDGSVDETAFLADLGRHFLECTGDDIRTGPTITAVPLPCLALPGMMVEIEAIAMSSGATERRIANPLDLPPLPMPFCHGLRTGSHTWVSGQSSRDPRGQARAAMRKVARVLTELDLDLDDIVKTGCWFAGDGTLASWQPGALARACNFQSPGPVVTELPTPCLPQGETMRVEAWAMRSAQGTRLERQSVTSSDWRLPFETSYSSAIRCGELVFLAGHLPLDRDGAVVHLGDLNRQTEQVMENTRASLQMFGLDLEHMVKQTSVFLGKANPKDIVTNQTLRSSFYTEPAGASTGVPMPAFGMEDVMVTVETVAMA